MTWVYSSSLHHQERVLLELHELEVIVNLDFFFQFGGIQITRGGETPERVSVREFSD